MKGMFCPSLLVSKVYDQLTDGAERVKQEKKNTEAESIAVQLFPFIARVFFISMFTNLLVLAPSLYMLEVYDRVINSRSHSTLLMLTILVIGLYIVLELLEWVRSRHMHEGALELDRNVRQRLLHAVIAARLQGSQAGGVQPLNDLKTIREALPSTPFLSVLDAPLALLILVVLFFVNSLLGWIAVGGALLQAGIGIVNERRTHGPFRDASRNATAARRYADGALKNAQVIESMAMMPGVHERWLNMQQAFLRDQALASDYAGSGSALSRMVQMLQGSILLGVGGWLALQGLIGGSLMIVGSILGGRLLAPLVQIIAGWRQIESARESWSRMSLLLQTYPLPDKSMPLPPPDGRLSVEGVVASPPGAGIPVLKGVSFVLAPGDSLAVVGPSASGKSTLARLMTGILPAQQGSVRLDGVDIHTWDHESLGPHIGYLPQDVELFDGTIAENIARFGDIDRPMLEKACRLSGIDAFIELLPDRYDTRIGADGAFLSGGQRQRVGLARAVYGDPRFLVLDEPDSSLDDEGDASLLALLGQMKRAGVTVVVVTQRKNLLAALDYMLVLIDGRVQKFGRRDEVLGAMSAESKPKAASRPQAMPGMIPVSGGFR